MSDFLVVIRSFKGYKNVSQNVLVTGRTRRETCGSICEALFQNMVLIQAGSINSKQVWQGQDRVILRASVGRRSANNIQQGQDKER